PGGVLQQRVAQWLGAVLRDRHVNAPALRSEVVAHRDRRPPDVTLQLLDVGQVDQPVAVDAEERASERRLDRGQREIDVELALGCMDEREAVGRLESPDGRRVQEDEALLPPRHHASRTLRSRRAALEKTLEALPDALLGKRLQDV